LQIHGSGIVRAERQVVNPLTAPDLDPALQRAQELVGIAARILRLRPLEQLPAGPLLIGVEN